jgi:hypothetical protein
MDGMGGSTYSVFDQFLIVMHMITRGSNKYLNRLVVGPSDPLAFVGDLNMSLQCQNA